MGNALTIELMCSKLPRKKFTPGIADPLANIKIFIQYL